MKIEIDTDAAMLRHDGEELPLYSDAASELLSRLWVKVGWNQKYSYTFSWLGVPLIQMPEDLVRYQEVVFRLQPDVIVETGVAHGGSAVLSASLLKLIGKGHVIAVDLEIRPHNRRRLEAHPLKPLITLIEGSSVDPAVVNQVRAMLKHGDKVLVLLDSDHSYAHVRDELVAYAPLISPGSYIVATDGVMSQLCDVPRGEACWDQDNPAQAAMDFVAGNPDFVIEEPVRPFNESSLSFNVTHWPSAWIRRRR